MTVRRNMCFSTFYMYIIFINLVNIICFIVLQNTLTQHFSVGMYPTSRAFLQNETSKRSETSVQHAAEQPLQDYVFKFRARKP